ncbi:hypothetical protein BLA50215_07615 [Burkholderia lata]|uniref:DUF5677 domain-containing protein n=1 Tax=Burkholderia lata (strain ATCC 17760 / DSM 23089 / LMG 22485 / NCIMB 9086 / R18194 / 383) TaxID=482957 RepID=UPI00145305F2|nr:DUF5677 domain-containing protein [Burkholderia lata]VWD62875.1 hypothetical protein BLA50215_07615 [Burkholderia lata]
MEVNNVDQLEAAYRKELAKYEEVLDATMDLSMNQHGIQTDGRGLRAMQVFTRQTLVAISLSKLLPFSRGNNDPEDGFWDVSSIASLTRSLMEGYVALFYFGTEVVGEEEAELRFFLGQYHRNREWQQIRKQQTPNDSEIARIDEGLASEMKRLREHPFLPNLLPAQRNKVLKGDEIYLTKADIEKRSPVVENYRLHYQLLSNLVHPLPLSIERIGNDRGRGVRAGPDIAYACICISLAVRFLAASVLAIYDHFSELEGRLAEPPVKLRRFIAE